MKRVVVHSEQNMKSVAPELSCTCAELLQVVAQVKVQLSDLERDPDRGDKPGCKAGVHTGARCQCFRRHQLITGQLGSTVAVRAGGEAAPVCVYMFAIMMKKASCISNEMTRAKYGFAHSCSTIEQLLKLEKN